MKLFIGEYEVVSVFYNNENDLWSAHFNKRQIEAHTFESKLPFSGYDRFMNELRDYIRKGKFKQ